MDAKDLGRIQTMLAATVIAPKWWERRVLRQFNETVHELANDLGMPVEHRRELRSIAVVATLIRSGKWFVFLTSLCLALLFASLLPPVALRPLTILIVSFIISIQMSKAGQQFVAAVILVSQWITGDLPSLSPEQEAFFRQGLDWGVIRYGCVGIFVLLNMAGSAALILFALTRNPLLLFGVAAWFAGLRLHQRTVIVALSDGTESTETQTVFDLNFGGAS